MKEDHPNRGPHVECKVDHKGRGVPRHCRCGHHWPCPRESKKSAPDVPETPGREALAAVIQDARETFAPDGDRASFDLHVADAVLACLNRATGDDRDETHQRRLAAARAASLAGDDGQEGQR